MTSLDRLTAALSDRYTIEHELGAGGMATVYLAHDIKHDRKVAIKALKPELAAVLGAERFIQEIKTTAALSHPHILPLFDSGVCHPERSDPPGREVEGPRSVLYYVMPYIEGETIREKLNREHQFSIDDAVGITTDVASALDYAHRHGVIHRDIKPENILLHDGRPMVMDFGIALAVSAAAGGRMTETGLSLGTPHYMSPEQATADKEITGRSDIYSLGSVCYEMLTGEPPHMGTSAQQIIMKIVTEDAAPVTKLRKSVPPNVAAAVNKSLEKLPADRFATAKEFAEALGNVAFATAMPSSVSVGGASRWKWALAGGLVAAVVIVAGARLGWLRFLMGHGDDSRGFDGITFTQRTFKTEPVFNARFASDGQTIVFSAAPTGNTPRLFIIRPDYPNPQILGDSAMQLLSISSRDQMAVLVGARFVFHRVFTGTLASMPVSGGAPREILAGVRDADWSPHDSGLAVIRRVGGEDRLEYPIGKVLYQTTGYLSDLRFSPKGDRIAFFVHPLWADDAGGLVVVDLAGGHRILTEGYGGLEGVVWSPDGERVLFDGQRNGGFYQTYSVTLKGQVHLALPNAGSVTLQDVSQSGSWLLTRDDAVSRLIVKAPGARQERDVSWLDLSTVPSISGDGLLMAFDDGGLDAGPYSETMIRKTDGSPAVRLGEGLPWSLSPDKQWVLSVIESAPARLMFYPTGAGQARQLDDGEFASYSDAQFFPGGKQLLVCGTEPEHASRCYVRPVDGGTPRPLTPDGTTQGWISPDGRNVLSQAGDSSYSMYPVDGTAPRPVPSLTPDDAVQRWSPDGRALWVVSGRNAIPVHVDRLDLSTGRRTPLVTFGTETSSGLLDIHFMSLADDPNVYAYEAPEYVSRVFEVTGLR